jgi:hypothetical protein
MKSFDTHQRTVPEAATVQGRDGEARSTAHFSWTAKVLIAGILLLLGVLHIVGAAKVYSDTGDAHPVHTLAAD